MTLQEAKDMILEQRSELRNMIPDGSYMVWRIDLKKFPKEMRQELVAFLERLNIIDATEHLRIFN